MDAFENIQLLFTSTCSLVKNRDSIYDFRNFEITQKSDHILYINNHKIKKDATNYLKQVTDTKTHQIL